MSQHSAVLACIFKNWTQISFILFLEFVLLQWINCSSLWAPAFALCCAWLTGWEMSAYTWPTGRDVRRDSASISLPSFAATNIHLLLHQQKLPWSPALRRGWHSPKLQFCAEEFRTHWVQEEEIILPKLGALRQGSCVSWPKAFASLAILWPISEWFLKHRLKPSLASSSWVPEGDPKPRGPTKILDCGEDVVVSPCYPLLWELHFLKWVSDKALGAMISTNTNGFSMALDKWWGWLWHGLGLFCCLLG